MSSRISRWPFPTDHKGRPSTWPFPTPDIMVKPKKIMTLPEGIKKDRRKRKSDRRKD